MHRSDKFPCVYILASRVNGTIYIGVTSDPWGRMSEHKQGLMPGFANKYSVNLLVYYETFDTMDLAITREKQLKKWNRQWKIRLIEQMNPEWRDLFNEHDGSISEGPSDTDRFRL